jgi:hypothetical protein
MAKILTTTGAVTDRNYIPSKAGKKGEFHHTFGAAVAEIDGKRFHLRQINAIKDGSFQDLDTIYQPDGKTRKARADLIMGDTHVDFADPGVTEATFGNGGMIETLRPAELVWHDVLDFHSASHHDRLDPFRLRQAQIRPGQRRGRAGPMLRLYRPPQPGKHPNVVVASNHHEHLGRWVRETDPRSDLRNCVFLSKTFIAMAEGAEDRATGATTMTHSPGGPSNKLKCIDRTTSSWIGTSRTSSTESRLDSTATRARTAPRQHQGLRQDRREDGHRPHPHASNPRRRLSGWRRNAPWPGLSARPSSWLHAHCAVYETGKRSLIFIIDGSWRSK